MEASTDQENDERQMLRQTYDPVVVSASAGISASASTVGSCLVWAVGTSHGSAGEEKGRNDAEELHIDGSFGAEVCDCLKEE